MSAAPSLAPSASEAAVASYHLDVKSVQRSAGRSATAAAAYRHAERIECQREGRTHDYRAKQGVEASFILAPEGAPAWAQDRQALWNAAEARDTRVNSVTAREWEVALPHELDASGRRALAEGFARELVARYGVAADVAIHAPHREGDKRNWHAHVMTTTRVMGPEGLTDKTRALDAQVTRGAEVTHMRERWASLQNQALERHGHEERVDHRSLEAQREAALARGDKRAAEQLDRAPEVKLGPTVSSIERREERAAERDGREYVPLTERGALVHEAREARTLLAELARVREALREEVRHRAEAARETYAHAREEGIGQIRAGLAALRAAALRQGIGLGARLEHGSGQERGPARGLRGLADGPTPGEERGREAGRDPWAERQASRDSIKERLGRITGREEPSRHAQDGPQRQRTAAGLSAHGPDTPDRQGQERSLGREAIRERLEALRDRARPSTQPAMQREAPAAGLPAHGRKPERTQEPPRARSTQAIREQLRGVLDRAKPVAQERGEADAPELDPINAGLRALLARERTALERHGPVARVLERARDEPAYAASFRSPQETQAFRDEMERRFDPDTLQRLGRGEERALAEVAENRLDGLCLARAWLDSRGEPEQSEARLSLADRIVDAQHDARRERQAHEREGHDWGL